MDHVNRSVILMLAFLLVILFLPREPLAASKTENLPRVFLLDAKKLELLNNKFATAIRNLFQR
jgi:hypothetical protein